jgi:malonyl-CoA/methylmalonyl-CoA synthetase
MYPSTLIDGLLARLREAPAAEALRDERGPTTRGELSSASGRLAFALLQAGLRRGDRLLLALPPDRRFLKALIAALRLGVIAVPAHPKTRPRELAHLVWDAGPRAACADEPLADLVRTTSPGVRVLDPEALLAQPLEDSGVELRHDHAGVTAAPEDPALILYTSGTTGRPKGAVHTQGSLAANLHALGEAWALGAHDRLLHCLPLHHLHGLVVGLLGCLFHGAAVELLAGFDPSAVLERLATSRATLFFGVPAMYAQLARNGPGAPLPALRLFVSGSAPLPPALKREFEGRFGHVILERYGLTEFGIALSQELHAPRPAGSVGRPLAGVEARIVAAEESRAGSAADAPAGSVAGSSAGPIEEGELWLRGPSLFRGYHEDEEATAEAMSAGWYRTGDLVRRAPDGSFAILGRLSTDLIKVKGHRVGALEVEAALAEHPGVAEAAVVGAPDEQCGEVPVAFVMRRDPALTVEALLAHAAAALAPHQVPRRIEFVQDLPRTGPGKTDRQALKRRAAY